MQNRIKCVLDEWYIKKKNSFKKKKNLHSYKTIQSQLAIVTVIS